MTTIAVLALVGLLAGDVGRGAGVPSPAQCDGPAADPWVTDLRDRVLGFDGLARFAVEGYGQPIACEGAVVTEFDGMSFGEVTLIFADGVSLRVQTMPPESSVRTLRAPAGFADEEAVRAVLQRYATGIGLSIDWSDPETTSVGSEVVRTFWDPDPGLNASASLILRDGRLVGVRLSMAL